MSDQAELLKKRREARQKRILASGESRLSKITGTTPGSPSMPTTASPAVALARDRLLKEEQERKEREGSVEEELEMPTTATLPSTATTTAAADSPISSHAKRAPSETAPAAKSPESTPTVSSQPSTAEKQQQQERQQQRQVKREQSVDHDADPDDSLGAPPTSSFESQFRQRSTSSASPQHQQALARMMETPQPGSPGFGSAPAFTVLTPQVDTTSRYWKLLHFVMATFLGLSIVYSEYFRHGDLARFAPLAMEAPVKFDVFQVAQTPVFWMFITMELGLQSSRMFLHGITGSSSGTLGTLANFLPSPFSDYIHVFLRYRLIFSSLVNDLAVVVFIVGLTTSLSYMFD